ncbi:hypothetical protein L249_3517 [Ophiocordyceps polyrhachis-furcata BCC 54312]|uniref:COP9 signalosome complex subunit 4 n=1 Tax=Ophiocordyceps polyrhachis-furcata BCC 54312 TaxID=1330021 RepID=A0A367LMQ7_9HYPO|nr:hypothetical protein L249_3517 [Ophiocordyceps polyrhachis-furcata BCC 54312]
MPPSPAVFKDALERIVLDARYHDVLSILKTARNGAVYGTKVRFPHALVMIFLFRSGTLRQKLALVLRATAKHASNLARFATIYKLTTLALKHFGPTPGKEGPYDAFFGGLLGGYVVFGQRSRRTGRVSSVNQQIVVYIFARVSLALARLAVKPGHGLPGVSSEPLHSRIHHYAWPAFASLSWALVMFLYRLHPEDLQPSLRSSMRYIYSDCDQKDNKDMATAPCAGVTEALARIGSASSDKKPQLYESLLGDIGRLSTQATAAADLKTIAESFLGQALGVVSTRTLLGAFIGALEALNRDELTIEVGETTLGLLSNQPPSSFLDATAALCQLVASAHEARDDFASAARTLAAVPLDGSQREVTDEDKARVWIRIVRNHLEVDDSTAAEAYVNKLMNIMHTVADADLTLHFRLSQARIQDARRDFLPASQRYHDISFSPAIADEERLHTLAMAVKCAILAPAGPSRSRALARLYKDERASQLDEFAMLEKMFLDRLLAPGEVDKFAEGLQPHQLATTSDGTTVLAKAVVEHNLRAASRLYANIHFDDLADLLGLDPQRTEETTARMIEQGRLVGSIDQLEARVCFDVGDVAAPDGAAADATYKELRRWGANIESLCEEVGQVTNALQMEFLDFVAANLVV